MRSHWKTTTGNSTKLLLAQTTATPWECHSLQECTMLVEEVWAMFTPLFSFTFTMDRTTRWDRNTLWMENIMPLRSVNKYVVLSWMKVQQNVLCYLLSKQNRISLVFLKVQGMLLHRNLRTFYRQALYFSPVHLYTAFLLFAPSKEISKVQGSWSYECKENGTVARQNDIYLVSSSMIIFMLIRDLPFQP